MSYAQIGLLVYIGFFTVLYLVSAVCLVRAMRNPRAAWDYMYGRHSQGGEPVEGALDKIRRQSSRGLVLLPIIFGLGGVMAYVKMKQQGRERGAERALEARENPLIYVHNGMTVAEVQNLLGPGELVDGGGEETMLWFGQGGGNPPVGRQQWVLSATIRGGKVFQQSLSVGSDQSLLKQMAIGLREPRRSNEAAPPPAGSGAPARPGDPGYRPRIIFTD